MCLYVNSLNARDGNKLQRIIKHGKNAVYVRRCQVIMGSDMGMKVSELAEMYYLSEDHVRRLIHQFNDEGFESLKPKKPGGKDKVFTEEQRAEIIELALIPPKVLGLPFTQWSLEKLKNEAIRRNLVDSISHETVREILKTARISHQRTKTWKESNDPEFEEKKTN